MSKAQKVVKGVKILDGFIKWVDRIVAFIHGLEKWTKTIKSASMHITAFKVDVVKIWKKPLKDIELDLDLDVTEIDNIIESKS